MSTRTTEHAVTNAVANAITNAITNVVAAPSVDVLVDSTVRGATQPPLLTDTIGAYFDAMVARQPDHLALIVRNPPTRWTYRELQQQVDAVASGLLTLGLERGDRIGIWAPNCAEWLVVQLATAKAGLILVNINPAYRTTELEYALNKVGCRALITATAFKSSNYLSMLRELAPELEHSPAGALRAARLPMLQCLIVIDTANNTTIDTAIDTAIDLADLPGMLRYTDVVARRSATGYQQLQALAPTLACFDAVNIQFTSGTTGAPKGATLTHHNLLNNAHNAGRALRLGPDDRLCIPVPLYHCFGMVLGNLCCITQGATIVYPGTAFDPHDVLQTVQDERCTALHGVPTMFIAELDHADFAQFDLSSLRTGVMAGSPCPAEVMRRVRAQMHMDEVTICYGMTESSPVSFQTATDDPVEQRVHSVGRIQPHLEAKIVDADGATVAVGVSGELLVRGYAVMQGYWNDPQRTADTVDADGWLHTGDLASFDAHGYCSIVGRNKDMVIRGGENVYPREIEEYLYTHPAVQDVQVIGVPDAKFGEEVCAWVRLREGMDCDEEAIRAFCRGRIAHYKIPRYVRFVDGFPMTVTGKVQKFLMREVMLRELTVVEVSGTSS